LGSLTWKAFLENPVSVLVAIDFFVVPTVDFKVLFVLIILTHERRQVVHFTVTAHTTEQWTAQQIVEAVPWDEALRYLLRDRDSCVFQRIRPSSPTETGRLVQRKPAIQSKGKRPPVMAVRSGSDAPFSFINTYQNSDRYASFPFNNAVNEGGFPTASKLHSFRP